MRIGVDIRTLQDKYYSGIPEYSYRLLKEILRKDKNNQYVLYYNSFRDLDDRLSELKFDNVEIVKTSYPNKIFGYVMQRLFRWPKLDRLLKVDVFFMPHLNFVALSDDVKLIVTIHDLSFLKYPEFFSLKKNIWHRAIGLNDILNRADRIIAVSDNTKCDILEEFDLLEDKVTRIYSGLSRDFRPIDNKKELNDVKIKYGLPDKFIYFLATLEPRKNLIGLIRAFESLCEKGQNNDHYLVISGAKGWKYGRIFRAWNSSKYSERIIFTSYVDDRDKPYLYNLCSFFVYPSFYEGFGFPPLEAKRCGKEVVVGANSSLLELMDDGFIYVDPFNVASIEKGMEVAFSRIKKDHETGEVKQNVEKYDWSETARKTLDIVEKLGERKV